tara:strand:- start:2183 stop:2866 length:684 start_codon:yes stop_codon:yes gene_type:complete
MFTTGVLLVTQLFFMYTTMIIAVPTGIKVFNWVATMHRGSISFEPAMLFAIAFVLMFTFGGLSGIMLSVVPADYQYHDSYFVVGHFHYVIVTGVYYALVSGVYYWYPKWTGRMYSMKLANWHFWVTTIAANFTFMPMLFVGLAGMPRRIPDFPLEFAEFNLIASFGSLVFGLAQLLFGFLLIQGLWRPKNVSGQVWDGAKGLEWTISSPPPYHSFMDPPKVVGKTYQ